MLRGEILLRFFRQFEVERLHVHHQACVLYRQDDCILVRVIMVGVPPAWRGDEGCARDPHGFDRVDDVAVSVDVFAYQGVGVWPG